MRTPLWSRWLEHPATRVQQRANDEHQRGANIGFFKGLDPSLGKSSLKRFVTETLLQGRNIPQAAREGTATCGNGTVNSDTGEQYGANGIPDG